MYFFCFVEGDLSRGLGEVFTGTDGLLVIISGPSGVGKDTVLQALLSSNSNLVKCITATTRNPRPGEKHGADYFYITESIFMQMVENGEFLEHALVHGNYYGTPKKQIEELTQEGCDVILNIDVQGASAVRKTRPDSVSIFILPPSMEELEKRLKGRKTENGGAFLTRLRNAEQEIAEASKYQYVVVNNTVEKAVAGIDAIITAEKHRVRVR